MRSIRPTLLVPLFVLCVALGGAAQETQAPATVFPEALLNGMAKFNIAFFIQGDLRGNIGPCG